MKQNDGSFSPITPATAWSGQIQSQAPRGTPCRSPQRIPHQPAPPPPPRCHKPEPALCRWATSNPAVLITKTLPPPPTTYRGSGLGRRTSGEKVHRYPKSCKTSMAACSRLARSLPVRGASQTGVRVRARALLCPPCCSISRCSHSGSSATMKTSRSKPKHTTESARILYRFQK